MIRSPTTIIRSSMMALTLWTGIIAEAQHTSTAELAAIDFLVGRWHVETDMRLSKNGPWEKSEGNAIIQKAIGETIFEEEFMGTKQGRTLSVKVWLGNDNRTKLYQRVAVDSDHGVLIVFEGKLENKTLSLLATTELNGSKLIHRVQYQIISDDAFIVESSRSVDEGKNWDRTGTMKYTRRK